MRKKEKEVDKVKDELDDKLNQVGNLVHDSVPVHCDEVCMINRVNVMVSNLPSLRN